MERSPRFVRDPAKRLDKLEAHPVRRAHITDRPLHEAPDSAAPAVVLHEIKDAGDPAVRAVGAKNQRAPLKAFGRQLKLERQPRPRGSISNRSG
jgi:hypothetical protein